MGIIKDKLIKALGGYTKKEYQRSERKYHALLDSKSDNATVEAVNYNIYKTLFALDKYAKEVLFGIDSDSWANRMYHCIHNNVLRILVRYVHTSSSMIYQLDTTLDSPEEFMNILKKEDPEVDEIFILEND